MANIVEKELLFFRDGKKIYGKEFIPAGSTAIEEVKMPAGGNARDMEYYCTAFAQMGYIAYCFDFYGGSVEGRGRSDGIFLDMTIGAECAELISVFESVKKFSYVDANRISLMRCSQGGISDLVVAKLGSSIENLIMFYPALCIPGHARMGRLGGACYDVAHVPEVIECPNQMKLSRRFHEEVHGMNPYLEISKYKGRVLLIHGTQDDIVNYSYAIKVKESYEKDQCSFMLIRDAGHCFNEQQNECIIIVMEHFLGKKKELLG